MEVEETKEAKSTPVPIQESERHVPILKLSIVSEGSKTVYDIDNYDLYNIFEKFGKLENIVQGNESTYFIVFFSLEDAKAAYSALNGVIIEELKARLDVKLCSIETKRTEASIIDAGVEIDVYQCKIEFLMPSMPYFSLERRVKGIQNYNIKRLKELTNREVFDGQLDISHQYEHEKNNCKRLEIFQEICGFETDEKLTIFIKSNNYKKYAAACKLTHELGANIQEEFKCFNERVDEKKFNGFKIKKVEKMEDYETTLMFKTRKGLENASGGPVKKQVELPS